MKLFFGLLNHKARIVMQLNLSHLDEKKIANKIMQGKSVITLQFYDSADETSNGAVIILQGSKKVQTIIGSWKFHHRSNDKRMVFKYFEFRPRFQVNDYRMELKNVVTQEYYIYYTFSDYKKL